MTRRVLIGLTAVALFGGAFVLLPALAVRANDALSLPLWRALPVQAFGLLLMLSSVAIYGYCATLFARRGRGTTSPINPPQNLVTSGIFGYSRNPIYVGYVAFLVGIFLVFGHFALLIYAVLVAAFIHGLIIFWEEPDLRRRFGPDYDLYARTVPRWLGVRPGRPE